jgi:hypothetical protein
MLLRKNLFRLLSTQEHEKMQAVIDRVLDLVLVGLVWIPVPLVLNGDCLEADNTRPELDETVPMFGRPERKGGP